MDRVAQLLMPFLCVPLLAAAEIETLQGRVLTEVTIVEETGEAFRFDTQLNHQTVTLTMLKRLVHRVRDEDGGAWRIITAKTSPTPRAPRREASEPPVAEAPVLDSAPSRMGWRGDGSGRFPGPTPPTSWQDGSAVRWKTALPDWGSGSPIVVGDAVLVGVEPHALLCFDRASGALRWRTDNPPEEVIGAADPGPMDPKGVRGWTCATPCSDGRGVWMSFGQGMCCCFELASGRRHWGVAIDTGSQWGPGLTASPILIGDLLLQQINGGLVALDAASGQQRWHSGGGCHLLGSLAPMTLDGVAHVVLPEGHLVRVADGAQLQGKVCEKPWQNWGPSVVVSGDIAVFHFHGSPKNSTCLRAYRYTARGEAQQLWQHVIGEEPDYFTRQGNSPIIVDDLVYTVSDGGHLQVLELASGELVHTQRWAKHSYGSLIAVGEVLYAQGKDQMHVFRAGRSHQSIADFPHGFAKPEARPWLIVSSPVAASGALYLRDRTHLWCIGGG